MIRALTLNEVSIIKTGIDIYPVTGNCNQLLAKDTFKRIIGDLRKLSNQQDITFVGGSAYIYSRNIIDVRKDFVSHFLRVVGKLSDRSVTSYYTVVMIEQSQKEMLFGGLNRYYCEVRKDQQ